MATYCISVLSLATATATTVALNYVLLATEAWDEIVKKISAANKSFSRTKP